MWYHGPVDTAVASLEERTGLRVHTGSWASLSLSRSPSRPSHVLIFLCQARPYPGFRHAGLGRLFPPGDSREIMDSRLSVSPPLTSAHRSIAISCETPVLSSTPILPAAWWPGPSGWIRGASNSASFQNCTILLPQAIFPPSIFLILMKDTFTHHRSSVRGGSSLLLSFAQISSHQMLSNLPSDFRFYHLPPPIRPSTGRALTHALTGPDLVDYIYSGYALCPATKPPVYVRASFFFNKFFEPVTRA